MQSLNLILAREFDHFSTSIHPSSSRSHSLVHDLSRIATSGFLGDGQTKICHRRKENRFLRPVLIDGITLQLLVNGRFLVSNHQNVEDLVNGKLSQYQCVNRRLNGPVMLKALLYFIAQGHRAAVLLPAVYKTRKRGLYDNYDLILQLEVCGLLRYFPQGEGFNPLVQEALATDALIVTRVQTWERGWTKVKDVYLKELYQKTQQSGLHNPRIRQSLVQPCYYKQEQYFTTPFSTTHRIFFYRDCKPGTSQFTQLFQEQLTAHQQIGYMKMFQRMIQDNNFPLSFTEKTALECLTDVNAQNSGIND